MKNIILADNQDITKSGLKFMLNNLFEITEFEEACNKNELLAYLTHKPDSLIILDYTLFDFESVNDLIILSTRFEESSCIVFSTELSDDFLRNLLYNTTSFSVLLKDCAADEISSAIKEAMRGKRFICNYISNMLLDSNKKTHGIGNRQSLTVTETEILREIALGKTTKEIAAQRYVSIHTIMTHRKNIFRKIEVNNVHEATKYAMRAGVVDLAEYYI